MDTKKKRILVVEDQAHVHQIITGKLEEAGFEVVSLYDGGEALTYITSNAIDLLVLDLMLPTVSGKEILLKMKKEDATKNIPVIVLTSKMRQSDIDDATALGVKDYVVKPFNPKDLVERVLTFFKVS